MFPCELLQDFFILLIWISFSSFFFRSSRVSCENPKWHGIVLFCDPLRKNKLAETSFLLKLTIPLSCRLDVCLLQLININKTNSSHTLKSSTLLSMILEPLHYTSSFSTYTLSVCSRFLFLFILFILFSFHDNKDCNWILLHFNPRWHNSSCNSLWAISRNHPNQKQCNSAGASILKNGREPDTHAWNCLEVIHQRLHCKSLLTWEVLGDQLVFS